MVKKLLFLFLLVFSTAVFSQKTLQNLTAAPNPISTKATIKFDTTKDQEVFLNVKNKTSSTARKHFMGWGGVKWDGFG